MLRRILNFLLEPHCGVCGQPCAGLICAACDGASPRLPRLCECCNRPLADEHLRRCGRCAQQPWLERAFFGRHYSGLNRDLLLRVKLGQDAVALAILRRWLEEIPLAVPPDTLVLPLPMAWPRLLQRGFNQAELLAKVVVKKYGLKLDSTLLDRRHRLAQSSLARAHQRRRNIRGAFYLRRPPPPRVLLVDDLMTSGATIDEARRCLKKGGAKEIYGLCLFSR